MVESMEPRGAFISKEAANARAREVFDEVKAIAGRSARSQEQAGDGGLFSGFVIPGDRRNVKIVEVRYDDGTIEHGNEVF